MLEKRSAGTKARALVSACSTSRGTEGRMTPIPGGGPWSRLPITAWAVGPLNGGSPASISYNTQPRL